MATTHSSAARSMCFYQGVQHYRWRSPPAPAAPAVPPVPLPLPAPPIPHHVLVLSSHPAPPSIALSQLVVWREERHELMVVELILIILIATLIRKELPLQIREDHIVTPQQIAQLHPRDGALRPRVLVL